MQLVLFPFDGGSSEKSKLLWLVKLRWMAIAFCLVLCGPAIALGYLTRATTPEYLGILGILVIFNLLNQFLIAEFKGLIGPIVISFQLAFDLIVLTGLLAVSGGLDNPFIAIFFLNASLGGILIPGRLSWPFLLLAHILLGTLQLQAVMKNEGLLTPRLMAGFAAAHVLVLGFWFVMRSLGAYLERQSTRQSQARLTLEKQDRLRSIGALAAGFSHEFASPLTVAKIRLERLKRTQDSEDVTEALNAIHSCQRVIEQMNSSQLDTRDFQFKTLVVGDLLRDVIESWSEDKEGIQPQPLLNLQIQDGVRCSLPPVNFAQVVLNLLDNAFDSRPSGTITVTLSSIENEIDLSVSDEGAGISESVLRQRGEPFVTTKPNGTGLGLYVSELFVQSLGGSLELRNLSPNGARVSLRWPRKESSR